MRWITAQNLSTWADSISARSDLPDLIRNLIRASARKIGTISFPSRDKAEIHGLDGNLVAAGLPFVPDGESFWELSTEKDYVRKAETDLTKRTEQTPEERRTKTVFVFVTPRTWNRSGKKELQSWRAHKKTEYGWKDVVVIHGVMLQHWLDDYPAVAANWARKIGLAPQSGVRSTDEFWDEYCSRFAVPLTEAVLLCQREEQARAIVDHARSTAGPMVLRADSPDEAIAFAIATIRAAEEDVRGYLEARTLVLEDDGAAKQFVGRANLIFIHGPAVTIGGQLAQSAPAISCVGRNTPNRTGYTGLEPPAREAFADAIKTMGVPQDKARYLARASGRSVTILRRLFPNGYAKTPEWVAEGRDLIPALLAGAWDAASKEDKKILCSLAGTDSYEKYEEQLRPFRMMSDSPIDFEPNIWKIRAPVDAFVWLGHLLGKEHFDRLRAAVIEVLSEIDPSLDAPPPELPFDQPKPRYSSWLRDGLASTLLQIAVHHQGAELIIPRTTPQAFVDGLIRELPGLSSDWRLIASLRAELPLLAEAAPRPFLEALESLLHGDGRALRPIFREGGFFSPFSPHTYLLWALERLAWDPGMLPKVSLILAKLAKVDPGGKVLNRPINSLIQIFLAWHPSTNASQEQRLAILDLVARELPEIGWNLITKLLPTTRSFGQNTPKPKYREAGSSNRERLTRGMLAEAYRSITEKVLALAGEQPERWALLIRAMPNFDLALRSKTYGLLEEYLKAATDDDRRHVWSALRELVNRHLAFKDTEWALPSDDLQRLSELRDRFAPADPVARISWLFDNSYLDFSLMAGSRLRGADEARERALAGLVEACGVAAVLELVESSKIPGLVASALRPLAPGVGFYDELLVAALARGGEKFQQFASAISAEALQKFPGQWWAILRARAAKEKLSNDQLTSLLLHWPDERSTWDFVASFGNDIEEAYWSKKQPWPVRGEPADFLYAAQHYLAVRRAAAAIHALGKNAASLPVDLLFRLLHSVVAELNESPPTDTAMLTYYLENILDALEKDNRATIDEIAGIEWAFFPLFEYGQRSLRLHRLMRDHPEFYVLLISAVYIAEGGEPSEPTPKERRRASAAFQLLRSFDLVPGVENGDVDTERLRLWVYEVRRMGEEARRKVLTDQHIGQVLAHAPMDPEDDAWPHRAVRDLIEVLSSDEVERGISIERINMRGVYTKAMFEGGKQERELAERYRAWAKTAAPWPLTASLLNQIAHAWDRDAEREDSEARKDKMRT